MNRTDGQSWAVRWAPRFMLAVHLPVLAQAPILVASDAVSVHSGPATAAAFLLAFGSAALHLRHVRAAARDSVPALWQATVALQMASAVAGVQWFGPDWNSALLPAMVSAMLLLTGVWRWALGFAVPLAAGAAMFADYLARHFDTRIVALQLVYYMVIAAVFVCALYGTVRLVPLVDWLDRTRGELAQAAVDRERLRLSRDLHDLLGHSLSAIALKGDLAMRLLPADPGAAGREAFGIGEVARTALHEMHMVTRDARRPVLLDEVAAAAALLTAAGVVVAVDVPDLGTSAETEAVLAWAVQEGATNVLRHSRARNCSMTLRRVAGALVLEMVNDGASARAADGSGLVGLAERAEAVGGRVVAEPLGDAFVLQVDVPDRRG